MKKQLLFLVILFLLPTLIFSQGSVKVRYLNVKNDNNIRKNKDPKLCLSCSENNFVIDGDESFGIVNLEFEGVNLNVPASSVELIINMADVGYAESGAGFGVYYKDEKIGNIGKVGRNTSVVIPLNASKIAGDINITLVLKANGKDGLYVLSKKSGFGPVLKLEY